MSTIQVSDKGQVTLPARIRKELGLKARSRMTVELRDGEVVLKPMLSIRDLYGILHDRAIPGMTFEKEREIAMRAVAEEVSREGLEPEYWPPSPEPQIARQEDARE